MRLAAMLLLAILTAAVVVSCAALVSIGHGLACHAPDDDSEDESIVYAVSDGQ